MVLFGTMALLSTSVLHKRTRSSDNKCVPKYALCTPNSIS